MAEFGEYRVDLINEEPLEGFTIRKISVLHKKVNNREYLVELLNIAVLALLIQHCTIVKIILTFSITH